MHFYKFAFLELKLIIDYNVRITQLNQKDSSEGYSRKSR
jgi:hypothetical protein